MNIYENVLTAWEGLRRNGRRPRRITFSPEGAAKARLQEDRSGARFTPMQVEPTHYLGLPFSILNDQVEDVRLHP